MLCAEALDELEIGLQCVLKQTCATMVARRTSPMEADKTVAAAV